ncbi:MAG TPA: DegV family protein [Dehalococcoidia bacterium]|nr:DegV family protein [Dehalococcoidia bacterium]
MMADVGVVTDSIACLTKELVEQYNIGIVPISICFRDEVYRDWVDITPTEAYELFLQDPERFTTSPASPGHYLEVYQEASNQTKNILCITLSSKLSTGYDMACVAREQAKSELPQISVDVLDSQTVTAAQGFIVLAAARAAAEGRSLAEVVKVAEEVRDRATFLLLLDTIRHVYRTGRIPKVAAQVGSMLKIKPILTSSSGLVRFSGAVRSRESGINRILNMMKDKVGQNPVHVAVMHAYVPDEAEKLKERISSEFNCAELWITEFSPVMGYATGTGTLGFAYYKE